MKTINLRDAKKTLENGGVVAIPTETVYGLGCWIKSDEGVRKIFSTKERPFFDPLIVHIPDIESAKKLTSEWTQVHQILAKACWPGPLTLIAKKNDSINPLITSGLDSVGLRCPRHPLTLELLSMIDGGIAAPSANKFGKTSPTTSEHVYHEFKNDVPILEGGACEVGIESTVVGVSDNKVQIYRPGFYTAKDLKSILEKENIFMDVIYAESPVAPGQLNHHYMPKIPLIIIPPNFKWDKDYALVESKLNRKFSSPIKWTLPLDASIAARELYQRLREFDKQGYDLILVSKEKHHEGEEWMGIWNRLSKAKTLEIN